MFLKMQFYFSNYQKGQVFKLHQYGQKKKLKLLALRRGFSSLTFLREENSLDIRENPTLSDGDASQQLVQFLIIPYGQLHIFNIPNKMLSFC